MFDALMKVSTSFVLPIRIFRMLEVPERPPALHRGEAREVVFRRRRGGGPFQGPRVPWIAPGGPAAQVRPDQVGDEEEDSGGLEEHSHRDDQVPHVPTAPGLV